MFNFHTSATAEGKALIEIKRGVEAVFGFVAVDFVRNYPRWSPEIEWVEAVSDGPMQSGYRIRQHRADSPSDAESVLMITEILPNRHFSYKGLNDPYSGDYYFEQTPETKDTQLTFSFRLEEIEVVMRPFSKLIRTAIQEGVTRTVTNIKSLVEAEA
jgi:Polyketide cyclase / dehydrase and lipid transport